MRRSLPICLALAAAISYGGSATAQMPGFRGSDHLGITVPDMQQAIKFFTEVIGCQLFFKNGPFVFQNDWMKERLNVHPRATIKEIRMLRCGHGVNIELFEYTAPDQVTTPPKNSDIGGYHLAIYVDDVPAAVEHLRKHGIQVMAGPNSPPAGGNKGMTWNYFVSPWGMHFELLSYPNGRAYEKEYTARLWSPIDPAK
jgi:catechol 2,3-dioxygenase-like lactoylglutathione lyase family enzyme